MSDEDKETGHRLVAYSKALGYLPSEVVGCNHSHYIVSVHGKDIPTPKELVFELQPGWELQGGRIMPVDDGLVAGEGILVPMIQFESETTPVV